MKAALLSLLLLGPLGAQPAGKPLPAPVTISTTTGGIKSGIRDAAGLPLADVQIRIVHRDGRVWVAATDAKGQFKAGGLPPGDYEITSLKPGYEGETYTIHIRANAWLLGVTRNPADLRPIKGRLMSFFGPDTYEAPAPGLKLLPRPGTEKIPMH
ncbi:MAG TPA: carboxypeptidase-like regulatory domain-containing protein [Holophagaceae bacterium]|nr:carboxypeptidase-like regulatory domain-containing protein [Holophagaceae bacterium]